MTSGAVARIAASSVALLVVLASGACGGPPAHAPGLAREALPHAFAEAFGVDATGAPREAVKAYVDVIRAAAPADGDPWQVAALEASLDALDARFMPSLGAGARDAALAYRTVDGPAIVDGLGRAASEGRGPFARGLLARGLERLAERRGDAAEAEKQRAASGCVREALVLGPLTWAAVTGVDEPDPLDRADAVIAGSYPVPGAFHGEAHPLVARAQGCAIGLSQESWRPGVRDVIVDVDVPRAQTIGLVLRAHGSAVLRAGGVVVARRPFELGDGEAARFVRVSATAGPLRLIARVGTAKEDDAVELDAFGEDGAPIRAHAPVPGAASAARATATALREAPAPLRDAADAATRADQTLLAATAAIASGSPREAERMLWGIADRADARPDMALVYGRAVETALDLSPATRAERGRSAYERVLEAWPASWEAAVAHAVLAGARRGREEAGIEALRDLDTLRSKAAAGAGGASPLLDAFEALTSGTDHLFDRAHAALDRARGPLAGTTLFADATEAASPEVGLDRVTTACDPARTAAKDTLDCLDALRSTGDRATEWRELARLRALLGAPTKYLAIELHDGATDYAVASRAFRAMSPAERTMTAFALLTRGAAPLVREVAPPDADRLIGLPAPWLEPGEARTNLMHLAATARDAPGSIAPLLRAGGEDPTGDLDATAERLAATDRAQPIMPNSATAILAHVERYEITRDGLLHWLLFDVRRVSGTTDVEENAQAAAPAIWGRATMRALRRRILKKDGRILEPDRTPRASQEHADLSQLEQGDAVEAVYEGWSSPGDTGDLGIDSPDLLPDRTAVHDATVELRTPVNLRGAVWSHPLLGKPTERAVGETRITTWHLGDQLARRVEDGVPKMDRNVGVSFSTAEWGNVARALRESVAALDEHDPEIAAWARDAAATSIGKTPRDTVNAVVIAAGKALREADSGTLSDYGGGIAPVQGQTARTSLTSHDGSRSWLILRSLRELGVPCDLVVAENDPFSADPGFPPHFGRFLHPLIVTHLPPPTGPDGKAGAAGDDVWIDADVAGPPLPAGRGSPELRGRLALRPDGTIAPLPTFGAREDERDEVDVRLALDAQGDARGTFAVVLRGRDAQELSEALFRTVGAERQRALRDVVLAWLPWANVDDVQLASTEGSWQVSLRAEVSVNGYAQLQPAKAPSAPRIGVLPGIDTLHWAWPRARVSSLAATFASRAGRESALAVGAAVQYHVHRRVDLPKGAAVTRMPGPLEVKAKLVDASRKMTVTGDGSILEDDFVLDVATGTIPPAEYDAFVAGAHAADDGFLAAVRVTIP
jgi:hypothetical protein